MLDTLPRARRPAAELNDAAGGYVRRGFEFAGERKRPGQTLSAEEVSSIPRGNLNALVNTGRLELFRGLPGGDGQPCERFLIHVGGGRYIVVEGRQVTPQPISKAEAEKVAAQGRVPDSTES